MQRQEVHTNSNKNLTKETSTKETLDIPGKS